MSTISTTYSGNLRTQAIHNASGNAIITDAPLDNNGRGEAFSPTDLVCAALGSCMTTIMGMVAERNNINLEGTRLDITKVMAANPRRISEIAIQIFLPPNVTYTAKEKSLLENAA